MNDVANGKSPQKLNIDKNVEKVSKTTFE